MTDQGTSYAIKERSATEVTVRVTVEAPLVQNGIDVIYRHYSREVKIPGFRKGRVPRAFLDSRFGRETFREEAQKALEEEHLPKALSFLDLRPVTPPTVNEVSFDEKGSFVFEASFSVLPNFDLPNYRGIELTVKPAPEVTEDDVRAALEDVRRHYGTLVAKTEKIVNAGDIVRIKEGEEEWDARAERDNPITAALIGHKVGETIDIDLDLPKGKTSHTSLSILGLKEVVLPDVDDELAKDAGYESLVALKTDIKEKLVAAQAKGQERAAKLKLLDRLVDQTKLPLPEALVQKLASEELERLKKNLAHPRSPLSFDDYLKRQEKSEEDVRSGYREIVTRRLRRELVLRKLAEKEGVTIGDDELEKLATAEAEKEGENPLRFIARLKAEDRFEDYRTEKVNSRVLDLLYGTAKITKEER